MIHFTIELIEGRWGEPIDATGALHAANDKPAAPQKAQMLRYRRPPDTELVVQHVGELTRGVLAGGEDLNDPKSHRFGQEGEDIHPRTVAKGDVPRRSVIDDGVLDDRERASEVIGEAGQNALRCEAPGLVGVIVGDRFPRLVEQEMARVCI